MEDGLDLIDLSKINKITDKIDDLQDTIDTVKDTLKDIESSKYKNTFWNDKWPDFSLKNSKEFTLSRL